MTSRSTHCQNCRTPLAGLYCHQCGQRDVNTRVAIWRLGVDLLSEAFEADGRLWRTLPALFWRPGMLVRRYADGHRVHYTSPVRILVFALAIGFLCLGLGANRTLDQMAGSFEDQPVVVEHGELKLHPVDRPAIGLMVEPGSSLETNLQHLDGMRQPQAARLLMNGMLDAAPTILLFLVPLFTGILKILYPRFLTLDHLLVSTLLHAQALILFGVAAVVGSDVLALGVVVWLLGQLLRTQKEVYGQAWPRTIVKWLTLLPLYGVLVLAAFVGTAILMVSNL